jgi:hypothetical protein
MKVKELNSKRGGPVGARAARGAGQARTEPAGPGFVNKGRSRIRFLAEERPDVPVTLQDVDDLDSV